MGHFVLMAWMAFTGIMAWSDFFTVTTSLPPRILVAVLPPLVLLFVVLVTQKGSVWVDAFDLKILTILQAMRVPVELVLYWLCLYHIMPELMTFQGRNYDIISGITAPLVYMSPLLRTSGRENF
ncbi:hypothetical protein [Pontibacter virosus]|uniref:hypothetical protein n=1 Tax=Pontibacter virosus TaxID=1765052 RepID=UPI000E3018DC|nr:hypothetical protein [Pontibacter virosus]